MTSGLERLDELREDIDMHTLFRQIRDSAQCTPTSLIITICNKNSSGDEIANVLVNDDIAHT